MTEKVPVQVTRMVTEQQVRQVPVQVCRMVQEEQVRKVPYQVCRQVVERVPRQVAVQVCRMVTEEQVRQVPVTTCRMVEEERVEPYEVRVCKWVCEKQTVQVPRIVTKQVPVTYTYRVPRTVMVQVPVDPCDAAESRRNTTDLHRRQQSEQSTELCASLPPVRLFCECWRLIAFDSLFSLTSRRVAGETICFRGVFLTVGVKRMVFSVSDSTIQQHEYSLGRPAGGVRRQAGQHVAARGGAADARARRASCWSASARRPI